ncbi:MAG TPA: TetR/AcrR family transcriptional regulator [Alphaproteobacteria bacterium]|nr:TetR/AcrR family transcriptional regulator [Alphaproteobacteria bacterium]
MPRRAVAPALLNTAERLFYRHGVHGVGIDAILAESGRSSRSLYQHFGSKEGLAVATLKRRDAAWLAWFKAAATTCPEPERQLLAMFDALETWFRQPDFHGCPFINVAGEFPEHDHPLRRVAADHKRALLDFIATTAKAAGFVAHARLARELFLLIEGAIVAALVLNQPAAARTARHAAATLIAVHRRDYAPAAHRKESS